MKQTNLNFAYTFYFSISEDRNKFKNKLLFVIAVLRILFCEVRYGKV